MSYENILTRIFYNMAFVRYHYSEIGFCTACARKERQARVGVKSARTYGESDCHGKVFWKVSLHLTLPRKAAVEEALVCKREPENIPIDTLCMAVKKELS